VSDGRDAVAGTWPTTARRPVSGGGSNVCDQPRIHPRNHLVEEALSPAVNDGGISQSSKIC
jgi:hypothetical protein